MRYLVSATAALACAGMSHAIFVVGDTFDVSVVSTTTPLSGPNFDEFLFQGSSTYSGDGDLDNGLEVAGVLNPQGNSTGTALVLADADFTAPTQVTAIIRILTLDDAGGIIDTLPDGYTTPLGGAVTSLAANIGLENDWVGSSFFFGDGLDIDFGFGPGLTSLSLASDSFNLLTFGPGGISSLFTGDPISGFVGGDIVGQAGVAAGGADLSTIGANPGIVGFQFNLVFDVEVVPTPGSAVLAGLAGFAAIRRRR